MYAFTAVSGSHFTAKIEKNTLRTNEKATVNRENLQYFG